MKKIYILFLFFLIAIVITSPLIFKMNSVLLGWPLDAYNYMWNVDTFWKQILAGSNPFFTQRIFYPLGTYLIFHTYAPFISLLGFPFLKNLVFYLNFLILISTSLSGFFTYLLAKDVTKDDRASFLSGVIYAISPIMVSFLISQHYYYVFAAPTLPLSLIFLRKFLTNFKTSHLFYFVLLFWICFLIDYYSAIAFILINLIYLVTHLALNRKKIKDFFSKKRAGVFTVLILTVLIPSLLIFYFLKSNNYLGSKSAYPNICSAKIQRFIIPSEFNPFLSGVSQKLEVAFNIPKDYDTPSIYLGFIIPLVAFTSLFFYKDKKTLPFLNIAIVFFLFSLGPQTKFFSLVAKLPFLGLIDCPQRYVVAIELPLAVLFGLTISKFKKHRLSKIIYLLAALVIIFEYTSWRIPFSKVEVPRVYYLLREDKTDRTVLELPSGVAESKGAFGYDWSIQGLLLKQMYWQTISEKPRVGGYTSRLDSSYYDFFKSEPVISDIFEVTSRDGVWSQRKYSDEEVSNFVEKFNLGFIILSPNTRQGEFSKVVENLFKNQIKEKKELEGFILYTLD